MLVSDQFCPICKTRVEPSARYPRYVCTTCARAALAADGRALIFSNESFSGGLIARYADTGEVYASHICFIEGRQCRADDAYLGGIVIQTISD
jgi:hypothetical protein